MELKSDLYIPDDFKKFLKLYTSEYFRSQGFLNEALETSKSELKSDLNKLLSGEGNSTDYMKFVMNMVESSVWISKSAFHHASTVFRLPSIYPHFTNSDHKEIIASIISGAKSYYTHEQLFTAVFEELNHHYLDPNYKTLLKFPKIEATIALVPGVVNELYRTAPFERGVQKVCEDYGLNFKVFRVSGSKNAKHNAEFIKDQIQEQLKEEPHKKIWLLAYSKGGIDCLHYLRDNRLFSEDHVIGLSTIASPILGNHRAHNKLINILTPQEMIANSSVGKIFGVKERDVIHPFKKSISHKYQTSWFKRNHKELPKIFYSSLALESQWYQSHLWMMLAKLFFNSKDKNDGVVDVKDARFPDYFKSFHLGEIKGHHLIGLRYSLFNQEALIESHIIVLNYLGLLK
jgi:hypothetical protein